MDVSEILGRIGPYLSMLLPMIIVSGVGGVVFWCKVQRRRCGVKRHKDAGRIGPTAAFHGGLLPMQYDFLASLGSGVPAAATLTMQVMKPASDVRLFVLRPFGAMINYLTQPFAMSTGYDVAEPGGKATVLKQSTVIADFKTFALAQIQKNRTAHA